MNKIITINDLVLGNSRQYNYMTTIKHIIIVINLI